MTSGLTFWLTAAFAASLFFGKSENLRSVGVHRPRAKGPAPR